MIVHDEWQLLPQRLAVHLPTATAVIADLHLGYAEARRRGGDAVPLVPLEHLLSPLHAALTQHDVRRLVVAGDLFEQGWCGDIFARLTAWLAERKVDLAGVVPGNHDRNLPARACAVFPEGVLLGRWRVVHGDGALGEGDLVHGHWHPAWRWRGRKTPCFLVGATRLVLPAFSRDAAGVDARRVLEWQGLRPFVIVGGRLLECGVHRRLGLFDVS